MPTFARMSDLKVSGVLDKYEFKLSQLLTKDGWEDNEQLKWGQAMIPKMRGYLKVDREKTFRWLGFLQGILYCNGVYTVEEMANHNRSNKKDFAIENPGHVFDRFSACSACGDMDGCHLWQQFEKMPRE